MVLWRAGAPFCPAKKKDESDTVTQDLLLKVKTETRKVNSIKFSKGHLQGSWPRGRNVHTSDIYRPALCHPTGSSAV